MSENVSLDVRDGIAWIGMDDGKVNALSADMIGEIDAALDRAEAEAAVTVLSGRPGIFSAGFDLRTFDRGPEASLEMVRAGAEIIQRLLSFPFPVITVCTGHAYPMGAFLMLSADVRFGAAGPWRIGMNEVAIGMTVPRFAVELARHRLTPPGFARVSTASMFDPEEARTVGYLDCVVDPRDIVAAAKKKATELATLDMKSYAATKARINEKVLAAIGAAIEAEMRSASAA
jgi:enoyl-CoA hydratase